MGENEDQSIMKAAIVAGATGLVGKELVRQLLESPRYSRVVALTRKPFELSHPKFTYLITDFRNPETTVEDISASDIFCCLGTTMAKAGSKEKFYEVDFVYPVNLAKATVRLGAQQYLLVSALGANKDSAIYYNRVKGEVEEAIKAQGFQSVHIFRPSLLLGPRDEKRAGEDAAKLLYKVFGFLIPEKYKAIESNTIAKAMIAEASREERGVHVHESKEIQKYAS